MPRKNKQKIVYANEYGIPNDKFIKKWKGKQEIPKETSLEKTALKNAQRKMRE